MSDDVFSQASVKRYQSIYDYAPQPVSQQAFIDMGKHMRKCGKAAAEFQDSIIKDLLLGRDAS